jgi:hypothetical protein
MEYKKEMLHHGNSDKPLYPRMDTFCHLHTKGTGGTPMENKIPKTVMNHIRQRFSYFLTAKTKPKQTFSSFKITLEKTAQTEIITRLFVCFSLV